MFQPLSPARRRTLIWLALGALALVIIAGGLGSVTFQPGKSFSRPLPEITATSPAAVGSGFDADTFFVVMRGVLAVALLLLPISLIYALMTKEGRRRLLTNVILVILVALIASQAKQIEKRQSEVQAPEVVGGIRPLPEAGGNLPPEPPAPSEEFVWIASIGLVAVGLAVAVWLGRNLLFKREVPPLAKIALEAERARADLAGGGAVEDAVVRAYRQMSRIVADARKLHRSQAMTPREFEAYLAKAGLPAGPVEELTRLFEEVRYGGLVPGAPERQAAIDSLGAIAAACRAGEK
jgi:hypothetical protein